MLSTTYSILTSMLDFIICLQLHILMSMYMQESVNIDKRAHTAAQRNLCESCGYGTQLPRAPKKPFSEGLLASSAISRTSKRGGTKSRQFHCVGARFGS